MIAAFLTLSIVSSVMVLLLTSEKADADFRAEFSKRRGDLT